NEDGYDNTGYIKTHSFTSKDNLQTNVEDGQGNHTKQMIVVDSTKMKNSNKNNDVDNQLNDDSENDNEGFEELESKGNRIGLLLLKWRNMILTLVTKHKTETRYGVITLLSILFIIYFGFAMSPRFGTPPFPVRGNVFTGNSGFALFFLVILVLFGLSWEKFFGRWCERFCARASLLFNKNEVYVYIMEKYHKLYWMPNLLIIIAIAIYLGLTVKNKRNYVSLSGVIVLIVLGTLGSKYPHRVVATFVIRTSIGYQLFDFLGNEVSKFIGYVDVGAEFVYGESFKDHYFVFRLTSIIIFFGAVINILYYWGAMQWIIAKIAWLMQHVLNTTAAESMNAAANIFVGMSEAPLMIMPLLPNMTISELHAILVGGFATMAGSVLATFILFGVPANHLIAASVMAAPGALGFAKLLLPETHQSKTTWESLKNVQLSQQYNVIDALLTGIKSIPHLCLLKGWTQ
ncbi:unnamed protein product, partial [Didymodactylos carnosus]